LGDEYDEEEDGGDIGFGKQPSKGIQEHESSMLLSLKHVTESGAELYKRTQEKLLDGIDNQDFLER
jgi:hypothetical protein